MVVCHTYKVDSQRVACACYAMRRTRPRLEHTVESMRISPYNSAAIAVCAHADCAERASMVSIRTIVIVFFDSRRRTSIASENPIRAFLHQGDRARV